MPLYHYKLEQTNVSIMIRVHRNESLLIILILVYNIKNIFMREIINMTNSISVFIIKYYICEYVK